MREIKFRAKRKLNGEWVYGSYVKGESEDWDFIVGIPDDSLDEVRLRVITNTVGQYTGKKDSNGVEVYEGDTVTIPEANRNYIVEFFDFCFILVHADPKMNRMKWGSLSRIEEHDFTIELIGNIHETK